MSYKKRHYRMTRRAEAEQQTRLRITESAVTLHGTVGPARTSISAIAEHAGVRRSTVYRHFPDEASIFAACSAHWAAANPFPELHAWAAIADSDVRLSAALQELFGVYRRTEQMMSNILRDEPAMPILTRMLAAYRAYLSAARGTLMHGRGVAGAARQRVLAAIGHALTFATWRSLAREQGLTDVEAADLMCRLVAAAAAVSPAAPERRRRR